MTDCPECGPVKHQPIPEDEAHCECEDGSCPCHRIDFNFERQALIDWILSADCDPQPRSIR